MKILRTKLVEGLSAKEAASLETKGLVRNFVGEKLTLLGYITVEGDKGNTVHLITVADGYGELFNIATKSDNFIDRLLDLIDGLIDDGIFGERQVKFGMTKTKSGNECLTVSVVPAIKVKGAKQSPDGIPFE